MSIADGDVLKITSEVVIERIEDTFIVHFRDEMNTYSTLEQAQSGAIFMVVKALQKAEEALNA